MNWNFDSKVSQQHELTKALNQWKEPEQSIPVYDNKPTFRTYTPHIGEESFDDSSSTIYQHPLLSTFKEKIDSFAMYSFSSLPNVSILQNTTYTTPNKIITNASLVPFFGPKMRQDMSGTKMNNDYRPNFRQLSSLYTGSNDFLFDRKPDTPDTFFTPLESKEKKALTSSGRSSDNTTVTNIDMDRYRMDITKKDDCFEQISVGPSLMKNSSIPASDGYQSMYRFIDDDKQRRYSYGTQMLEPLVSMDVPTFPRLPKPDTSSMPHSNISETKPRIFDGAIDQKDRFSFVTPPPITSNDKTPITTRNQSTQHKYVIQKDLGHTFLSTSFVNIRQQLHQGQQSVESFENTTHPLKQSLTLPVVKGQAFSHPIDYHIAQTTKLSQDRGTYDPISINGPKSLVAIGEDTSALYNNTTRRLSESLLFTNHTVPRCNTLLDKIQCDVYPTKRINVNNNSQEIRDVYPQQRNMNTFHHNQTPRSVIKKEVPMNGQSETKKIVRFAVPETYDRQDIRETKRHTEIPIRKMQNRIQNNFQQHIDTKRTTLQDELRLIEYDYQWPKYTEPSKKKHPFVSKDMRITKRSSVSPVDPNSTNMIGIKKPSRTGGETIDNIKLFTKNLSLKKEQKIWPSDIIGSSTHTSGPVLDRTPKPTRTTTRTTDQEYDNKIFIPSYKFPTEHSQQTSRRYPKSDSINESPRPIARNTTQNLSSFYENTSKFNRSSDNNDLSKFSPIPTAQSIPASSNGVQSTNRT